VIVERVARAFVLPEGALRVEPFAGGHINESWLVTVEGATTQRFLLQRVNERVFLLPNLVMENVARVTRFAAAALLREGVPDAARRALRLVPSTTGEPWHVDWSGAWWRMFPYVEGTVTRETARSADEAYQAARAFGRFQRLLGSYDGPRLHETIPAFHETRFRVRSLVRAARVDRAGRVHAARPELEALLARRPLARALTGPRDRGALPERVVHNDAKIANVLLDARTGEGLCVVDLDTVMPGLSLYDFGDLARSTASDAAEDETDLSRVVVRPDYFAALASGFLDGAGDLLGTAERRLLVTAAQVITYEQAVRFLTDFLDADRYYRTDPERPLHNLERTRAQLALLEAFERDATTRLRGV